MPTHRMPVAVDLGSPDDATLVVALRQAVARRLAAAAETLREDPGADDLAALRMVDQHDLARELTREAVALLELLRGDVAIEAAVVDDADEVPHPRTFRDDGRPIDRLVAAAGDRQRAVPAPARGCRPPGRERHDAAPLAQRGPARAAGRWRRRVSVPEV